MNPEKKEIVPEMKEAENQESTRMDDEQMKKVSGGTGDSTFGDFFDSDGFDKELIDDGTGAKNTIVQNAAFRTSR